MLSPPAQLQHSSRTSRRHVPPRLRGPKRRRKMSVLGTNTHKCLTKGRFNHLISLCFFVVAFFCLEIFHQTSDRSVVLSSWMPGSMSCRQMELRCQKSWNKNNHKDLWQMILQAGCSSDRLSAWGQVFHQSLPKLYRSSSQHFSGM